MDKKNKYQILTEEFSNDLLKKDLSKLINICIEHKVLFNNILFGYAWGDLFYNKELHNKQQKIWFG